MIDGKEPIMVALSEETLDAIQDSAEGEGFADEDNAKEVILDLLSHIRDLRAGLRNYKTFLEDEVTNPAEMTGDDVADVLEQQRKENLSAELVMVDIMLGEVNEDGGRLV